MARTISCYRMVEERGGKEEGGGRLKVRGKRGSGGETKGGYRAAIYTSVCYIAPAMMTLWSKPRSYKNTTTGGTPNPANSW